MGTLVECIAACDIYDMVLDPAFHQITSGGGWVKIEWDRGSGVRGIDLERELKRKRIPICGRGFTMRSERFPCGTLSCYVKRKQARWAEYVLLRKWGVPLLTTFDERNAEWAAGKGPVPGWEERQRSRKKSKRRRR